MIIGFEGLLVEIGSNSRLTGPSRGDQGHKTKDQEQGTEDALKLNFGQFKEV